MVQFKAITDENYMDLIQMKEKDGFCYSTDFNFITDSLAMAWLYRDRGNTFPFAIYHGETLVGFMMLIHNLEKRDLHLWRFMMAAEHRGQELGVQSVELLIRLARESGKYDYISLDCSPKSEAAVHIYKKLGFRPTGESSCGFDEYRLELITSV